MPAIRRVSIFLLCGILVLGLADSARAKGTSKQPDTPPRTSPTFSALDKNQDGRLTLDEFKAGFPDLANSEETFKSLDKNGDGVLSLDEYKAGYPDPVPPPKPGKGGKNGNSGKKAQAKPDAAKAKKLFAKLDKNGDGKLSLDEFKAAYPKIANPEATFKSIDTNHDGFLSLSEFTAGMPKSVQGEEEAVVRFMDGRFAELGPIDRFVVELASDARNACGRRDRVRLRLRARRSARRGASARRAVRASPENTLPRRSKNGARRPG